MELSKLFFFGGNRNTYQYTYENSNTNVLNRVYNTLHNQSTTKKGYNKQTGIGIK